MRLIKTVAPILKAQGSGRIVNIASVAGLIHLTRCMAVALAPEVLVNCVAPGLLEGTRPTEHLRAEQVERANAGALLQRDDDKDDPAATGVAVFRTRTKTGQP